MTAITQKIQLALALTLAPLALNHSVIYAADAQPTAASVNVSTSPNLPLTRGAKLAGLDLRPLDDQAPLPFILVWQAEGGGTQLDQQRLDAIAEHLRHGRALLILSGKNPGVSAHVFTPVSPSTAWQTLLNAGYRGGAGPGIDAGEFDETFFPTAPQFKTSYRYRLRPLHVSERGETRYERLDRFIGYANVKRRAGEPFLTRPLLNRNWQTRLFAADATRESLLITGEYGAGRVAIFAAGADSGTPEFWQSVFAWLKDAKETANENVPQCQFNYSVNLAKRTLTLSGKSASPQTLALPVVARISGWNGELLGDQTATLTLSPGRAAQVEIPLPLNDARGPAPLAERDEFSVRLGVLSPAATALLFEKTIAADFTPPLTVSLAADELGAKERTLPGPKPDSLALPRRGGLYVSNLAYLPGETATLTLSAANDWQNLAPRATVSDSAGQPLRRLNDRAASNMLKRDKIEEDAVWTTSGTTGENYAVRFTFPEPVRLDRAVISSGVDGNQKLIVAPGAVSISADGKEVFRSDNLDEIFVNSRAELDFPPAVGREWVLEFPWRDSSIADRKRARNLLNEIELYGRPAASQAPSLNAALTLSLSAPDGQRVKLGELKKSLAPGEHLAQNFTYKIPAVPAGGALPLRVELSDSGGKILAALPLLAVNPVKPIHSSDELRAAGKTVGINMTVSGGLRTFFPIGSGARETATSWGSPEDYVFAYARRLRQTGRGVTASPARLFLSTNDFSHYSTPWGPLADGELFFSAVLPELVERRQSNAAWREAECVTIGMGDRWDSGPATNAEHTTQEYVEFDRYLRNSGRPGLGGRTRMEIKRELDGDLRYEYANWLLQNYLASFKSFRDTLGAGGRTLLFTGQGIPLLPPRPVTELSQMLRGMSDDDTWGAGNEDFPMTAGRQLGYKAFNPAWELKSNLVWGWDNTCFNNQHWYSPVGTTESSRRHHVTRAWRGALSGSGAYHSMHTFGYGMNGYNSYVPTRQDWQENWNAAERQTLIAPDGPLGLGVIVGVDVLSNPAKTVFSGGGMGGSDEAEALIQEFADVIGRLHHAGLPVAFSANTESLAAWPGQAPLVVPMPSTAADAEFQNLARCAAAGQPLIVLTEGQPLPPALAALFADARPVSGSDHPLSVSASGIVIECRAKDLTERDAALLAAQFREKFPLWLSVHYPPGAAGHGFTCSGAKMVTVEDLWEIPRDLEILIRAGDGAKSAVAVELNTHQQLEVTRSGEFWKVKIPTRAGDGNLIWLEEK